MSGTGSATGKDSTVVHWTFTALGNYDELEILDKLQKKNTTIAAPRISHTTDDTFRMQMKGGESESETERWEEDHIERKGMLESLKTLYSANLKSTPHASTNK